MSAFTLADRLLVVGVAVATSAVITAVWLGAALPIDNSPLSHLIRKVTHR